MMNYFKVLSYLFLVGLVFSACKNTEGEKQNTDQPKKEKKVLTQNEKKQINSVMTKAMVTPEAKTFVSLLVTDGLTDMLSKQEGPFTLLSPTSEAFKNLKEEVLKDLQNPKKKTFLDSILKRHILPSTINTVTLTQKIHEGNGMYQTINLLGETLTFKKEGDDIIVTNEKGEKAKLTKTDIEGENGVLHLLNSVLIVE